MNYTMFRTFCARPPELEFSSQFNRPVKPHLSRHSIFSTHLNRRFFFTLTHATCQQKCTKGPSSNFPGKSLETSNEPSLNLRPNHFLQINLYLYKHLMFHLPTQVDEEMASLSTSLLGIRRMSKAQEKTKNTVLCKKHPKHRQSPGVCSLCLNERLSIFIKATSSSSYSSLRLQKARHIVYYSSTTSLSSSSSVSSCPSPLVDRRCYLIAGGSGREKGSLWMTKSRSVAYKADDEKRKKKATRGGFFFRFGGFKKKEQESVVDN